MMNSMDNCPVFEQSKQPSTTEQSQSHNTGRWTGEEHNRFLQGLQQHGKVWKSIATVVKTRSIVQVRTHAQKYFMKMNRGDSSPTPTSKPSTGSGPSSPVAKDVGEKSPTEHSTEPLTAGTSVCRFKGSQWKSATTASIPKSKSYGGMSNLAGGDVGYSLDKAFHYPRSSLHMPPSSIDRTVASASKPRARKFDEIGNEHYHPTTKILEKVTKKKSSQGKSAKTKKAAKAHASKASAQSFDRAYQSLPYFGPHTAPGLSYSSSFPSLHERQGPIPSDSACNRKSSHSSTKKAESRNKRARLSKNAPMKYPNYPMSDNSDSPTHMSHPLSCPDFSYYSQDTTYPYPSKPDIDAISEQIAHIAQIPSCDSETEDSLDLENLLLKESLLSSGKKEWPDSLPVEDKVALPDEFSLMKPEDSKLGLLDCDMRDLKLKVPGNEGFSLPQKYSPTSVMEPCPTWAALTYPDFVKEEKDLNLGADSFMPMSSSNDENNLFWFGDDSFDDLLETM